MKKVLSLFMAAVMLCSLTAGIDFSAYAGTYYEHENNDSFANADNLPMGSSIKGRANEYDYDYYKIDVTQNGVLNLRFDHDYDQFGSWWCIYLYEYDKSSMTYDKIDFAASGSDYYYEYSYDGFYSFPLQGVSAGKQYYVVIEGSGKVANLNYTLSVSLTPAEDCETEWNNGFVTADEIAFGSYRYGYVNNYDVDYYKITVPYGQLANFQFTHDYVQDGSWWCIYLYKYNEATMKYDKLDFTANGSDYEYEYSYDGGYAFPLTYSAGTYYVVVEGSTRVASVKYAVSSSMYVESPATPSNLKASKQSQSSMKLSWSGVANASGYVLQMYNGGAWYDIAYPTGTSYTVGGLGAGSTNNFRVCAYKNVGGANYYSDFIYLAACTKPKTVSMKSLKTYKKGHKIKVYWKKVSGGASGYQIYWAKDKKFKKVVAKKTVSGRSTTSYTGKNFTKGKKYYVKVRAYKTVNGKKYYGSWSKVKSVKAK